MRASLRLSVALAVAAAALPPAAAASTNFLMCYERLKQTVGLIVIQGGDVEVVEDDPGEGRYRVVVHQASGDKAIWCTADGNITTGEPATD